MQAAINFSLKSTTGRKWPQFVTGNRLYIYIYAGNRHAVRIAQAIHATVDLTDVGFSDSIVGLVIST
jgi:hypothetical protein